MFSSFVMKVYFKGVFQQAMMDIAVPGKSYTDADKHSPAEPSFSIPAFQGIVNKHDKPRELDIHPNNLYHSTSPLSQTIRSSPAAMFPE